MPRRYIGQGKDTVRTVLCYVAFVLRSPMITLRIIGTFTD
jgi:hypothetical protein